MSEQMTNIEFSANALAPMSLFMAKNDIRYYLNGIRVMPHPSGGCIIAATDGHRLALWYDKNGICTEPMTFKISTGLISASKKRSKLKLDRIVRLIDGRLVLLEGAGVELFVQAGKAEIEYTKYPDIWRVVPKKDSLKPGLSGSVNSRYLSELGEVPKLLKADNFAGVDHFHDDSGKIVTVYSVPDVEMMVITMTMRSYEKPSLPDCFFFIREEA